MAEKLPVTPDLLVELELIKRAKYAYLRMVDQHRFDDLHEVMTDDCTAAYSDGEYSFDDLAGIIVFLHENMGRDQFLSSHACHHPEIDIYDDGTATGIWKLEDQVIITDFGVNLRGAAFYEDRYVKTERGPEDHPHRVLPHVRGDASGHLDRGPASQDGRVQLTQRISQSADIPAKRLSGTLRVLVITTPASTTAMILGMSSPNAAN